MPVDHMTREQLIARIQELDARLLEQAQGWQGERIDRNRYIGLVSKLCQRDGVYFDKQDCSDLLQELNAEYSVGSWARWHIGRLEDDYKAVWTLMQASEPKEALQADWERQRDQIRELKRQLTGARENNEQRNRELDALHYVWCDGGCTSGVHRWSDQGHGVTQEIVDAAIYNTERLKRWWKNRQYRLQRDEARTDVTP